MNTELFRTTAAYPVSSPTRAAIMRGRYPVYTGITHWIPGRQANSNYFSPYGNPRLEDGPVGVHNPMQGKEQLIQRFTHKSDSMGLTRLQAFTR